MARVFVERIIAPFGRPQRVRVDSGPEFKGAFQGVLESIGC